MSTDPDGAVLHVAELALGAYGGAARTQDEETTDLSHPLEGLLQIYELVMGEHGLPLLNGSR